MHATPSIFVDDTQMVTSSCKIFELQNQLAEDIENVIQWMADNKFSLNVLKTDFIIVGIRLKLRDLEETLCITVQNESIYRVPFVKSLGFFMDENQMKILIGEIMSAMFSRKFLQVYQFLK